MNQKENGISSIRTKRIDQELLGGLIETENLDQELLGRLIEKLLEMTEVTTPFTLLRQRNTIDNLFSCLKQWLIESCRRIRDNELFMKYLDQYPTSTSQGKDIIIYFLNHPAIWNDIFKS